VLGTQTAGAPVPIAHEIQILLIRCSCSDHPELLTNLRTARYTGVKEEMMQAAVLHAIGEPLRIEEVPTPRPGLGQVLVKIAAAGVASEVAITSSTWGSRNDLAEVIALAQEGKLTAATESHRLDDINEVLDGLEHGLVEGRAVVVP
jgi:D-arabinose 1-dehydrogenase-like Zn-dependent alcohol dehydrogenase